MDNISIRPPSLCAMHFPTSILWSRSLLIFFLNPCTRARPQGELDALTQFLPENLSAAFGTPLIATGDTSSDSNSKTQQTWTENPELLLLAGAGCNGAAISQNSHSKSWRSFIRGGREVCSPDDKDQILKQEPQEDPGQQPGQAAAQPLLLAPTLVNPDPEKMETTPKGVHPDASLLYHAIYNIPGEDGLPDDVACALFENPLLRVPICAPPEMVSPAPIVMPARFWQRRAICDIALDESLWCCLMARRPFHEVFRTWSGSTLSACGDVMVMIGQH